VVPLWTECVSVLSRYFDVETDIALASAKRSLQLWLRIDAKRQSCYFNQAIMEFVLCNAYLKPNCGVCVFNDKLRRKKKESRSAACKTKLKVRNRYFNYLVVSDENENTLIQENR
jgi:A/G-specific adenine glycosylase